MENEIEGIVLDARERAKSSYLVDLLCEQGLISLLASPSTLKMTSWALQDLIQPLHKVHFVLEKRGDWYKLKEGVVQDRFESIRSNWPSIEAAQHMRWAAQKMARHGLECSKLYIALFFHLKLINEQIKPAIALASFLSKALCVEGYIDPSQPFCCQECEQGAQFYGPQGGWLCARHSNKQGIKFEKEQLDQCRELSMNRSLQRIKQSYDIGLAKSLLEVVKQL